MSTTESPPVASTSVSPTPSTSTAESSTNSQSNAKPPSETSTVAPKSSKFVLLPPELLSYFIAGGAAGAASRTVVSPLERLKIIQQVQPRTPGTQQYTGVFRSLVRMWREEGFKGFMRGNGINCVRIVPYSAVQFTTYEQLKKLFTGNGTRELNTITRLSAGALAGITSVCATYPLDLIRARLSIASASIMAPPPPTPTPTPNSTKWTPGLKASMSMSTSAAAPRSPLPKIPGMWGMTLKVMREEGGVRALYRGLIPTAVGVAPYVGINFTTYETLRILITPPSAGKPSVVRKLLCGALAGSISQTLTYPFDVLRRKMQVVGMRGQMGHQYNGAIDAMVKILQTEGIRGLYRGIWPNLLKVAPSIATSFYTYETVKEFLGAV